MFPLSPVARIVVNVTGAALAGGGYYMMDPKAPKWALGAVTVGGYIVTSVIRGAVERAMAPATNTSPNANAGAGAGAGANAPN